MQNKKKVLFKITNLKQHFPLKNKRLAVKAVDGVDVNIYDGETFGLVGESGCGKSTFGRVLLQLYQQTDGRTMYYGRSLEDLAPSYVKETILTLSKRKNKLPEFEQKRDESKKLFENLKTRIEAGDEKDTRYKLYDAQNQFIAAEKHLKDAYLDIVQIIGGLIVADNMDEVSKVYLNWYNLANTRHELEEKNKDLELDKTDLEGKIKIAKENNKRYESLQLRLDEIKSKKALTSNQMAEIAKKLDLVHTSLDELRAKYKDNEDFEHYEEQRDGGIDL